MGLLESIAEVTEEENKLEGRDVEAEEKEPTHADTREKEQPSDKPKAGDKTDSGGKDDDGVQGAEKPVKKADEPAKKDEAKPAEGAGADPAAADAVPDAASFAKLRYDAAQAKRRAEAAEARLAQAPTQPQPGPAAVKRTETERAIQAEPDKNLDPEAHLRWELSKTQQQLKEISDWKQQKDFEERRTTVREKAIKEYQSYETEFQQTVPDYKEATAYGVQALRASLMTLHPNLKGDDLNNAIKNKVLELGAQAEARGEQPAEFFYKQSKEWGYKPAPAAAPEKPAEPPKAPSIKNIAEHKKRSASSLTPGGKSGAAPVSKEMIMSKDLTLADFAKLSPSQLRELEAMEG